MNAANPSERDSHAKIRVEQDAAGGETPLLCTDPSRACVKLDGKGHLDCAPSGAIPRVFLKRRYPTFRQPELGGGPPNGTSFLEEFASSVERVD
jgi:hypothetical protein